jgi:acyl-CoA dehydrogenase
LVKEQENIDNNMSETGDIIVDTARRIFDDLNSPEIINAAEEGQWPQELWQAIEESGLTLTWVPDSSGGVGASMLDAFAVLKAAGAAALPVPLAETLMAGWFLAKGNLQVPVAPMTVVCSENLQWNGSALSGSATGIPHARNAKYLVSVVDHKKQSAVLRFATDELELLPGVNLAGEPWDTIKFLDSVPEEMSVIPADLNAGSVEAMGALVRCVQAAGAMSAALELTIDYAMERVQFGRPIAKFQALQHSVAGFAGQVAAINAAADSAAEAVARGQTIDHNAVMEIATAKIRLEEAVCNGAAVAHQVHGAMGFTYEHRLHHLTRRLWSWREEYGSDVVWSRRLGDQVLQWGADGLWPNITAVSDAR